MRDKESLCSWTRSRDLFVAKEKVTLLIMAHSPCSHLIISDPRDSSYVNMSPSQQIPPCYTLPESRRYRMHKGGEESPSRICRRHRSVRFLRRQLSGSSLIQMWKDTWGNSEKWRGAAARSCTHNTKKFALTQYWGKLGWTNLKFYLSMGSGFGESAAQTAI